MKLHEQVIDLRAQVAQLKLTIATVASYVASDKFQHDNMVNTNDILLRINEGMREYYNTFEGN